MRRVADAAPDCKYLLPLLQINRQLAPFHRSCCGEIYFTGVILPERPTPNCRTLQGFVEREGKKEVETKPVRGRKMEEMLKLESKG